MKKALNLLLVFIITLSAACSPSKGARKGPDSDEGVATSAKVMDDVSIYRPKYPVEDMEAPVARVEPTAHENSKVAVLMDSVASVNKNIKYAQGYRILAYNGSERQTVMSLRKAIIARVPEQKDYLTYQQPHFRLKIGDYFSRIEAQQVLNQILDLIPNAHIVQDQINIPKN
ncbi:sporulation protein [Pontibacter sp. JH31]|uniref:Sporulation protein n=1 Tax=Pontibacter aquaedesilientis TaxID=2766980 RepID=A0ABR7XIZ2_9BACT|nr:sporulation protein [Pontibacter aquaedesilientis]MBD1398250.1 sporulation protein [Pontibacter aquaedesilientis]